MKKNFIFVGLFLLGLVCGVALPFRVLDVQEFREKADATAWAILFDVKEIWSGDQSFGDFLKKAEAGEVDAEECDAVTAEKSLSQPQGWERFLATHEKLVADTEKFVKAANESIAFLSDFLNSEKERLLEEARKDAEESAKNAREYEQARKEMFKSFENYFKR